MIELTRCGAPDNDRYLPAVMTQGDASTYQTMIDNSTMQTRPQQMVGRAFGSAQGGTTQNSRQQGMAPSAVQGGAPPSADLKICPILTGYLRKNTALHRGNTGRGSLNLILQPLRTA